jgi:hypothetical protein
LISEIERGKGIMIKVWNSFRRNDNLYTIKTKINASAARVDNDNRRSEVEYHLEKLLDEFAEKPSKRNERNLREYLTGVLFKHFIDIIAVNEYVLAIKKFIEIEKNKKDHSGFIFLFDFDGYDEEKELWR